MSSSSWNTQPKPPYDFECLPLTDLPDSTPSQACTQATTMSDCLGAGSGYKQYGPQELGSVPQGTKRNRSKKFMKGSYVTSNKTCIWSNPDGRGAYVKLNSKIVTVDGTPHKAFGIQYGDGIKTDTVAPFRYHGATVWSEPVEFAGTLNKWHHLVATVTDDAEGDRATVKLFLDGKLSVTANRVRATSREFHTWIGGNRFGSNGLIGSVHRFRAFPMALTDDQVLNGLMADGAIPAGTQTVKDIFRKDGQYGLKPTFGVIETRFASYTERSVHFDGSADRFVLPNLEVCPSSGRPGPGGLWN